MSKARRTRSTQKPAEVDSRLTVEPMTEDRKKTLGARVRELRLALDLTQQRVADSSDLSVKQFGKIERGEANPTLETLVRIARSLSVTTHDLFRPEDESPTQPDHVWRIETALAKLEESERTLFRDILESYVDSRRRRLATRPRLRARRTSRQS